MRSKIISFVLSMPNRASWNGRWSGDGNLYVITRAVTEVELKRISDNNFSFYYRWNDGWGASITCKIVDRKMAALLRRKSKGFWGYDWMVSSILRYGRILADHELKQIKEHQAEYIKEWSEDMQTTLTAFAM